MSASWSIDPFSDAFHASFTGHSETVDQGSNASDRINSSELLTQLVSGNAGLSETSSGMSVGMSELNTQMLVKDAGGKSWTQPSAMGVQGPSDGVSQPFGEAAMYRSQTL